MASCNKMQHVFAACSNMLQPDMLPPVSACYSQTCSIEQRHFQVQNRPLECTLCTRPSAAQIRSLQCRKVQEQKSRYIQVQLKLLQSVGAQASVVQTNLAAVKASVVQVRSGAALTPVMQIRPEAAKGPIVWTRQGPAQAPALQTPPRGAHASVVIQCRHVHVQIRPNVYPCRGANLCSADSLRCRI